MNQEQIVIVDLEGTLTDNRHRIGLAQALSKSPDKSNDANWEIFNEGLSLDPPNIHICIIVKALSTFYPVFILSSKPERYKPMVVKWLNKSQVADYIAGMTDRYAIREYERVFNPVHLT